MFITFPYIHYTLSFCRTAIFEINIWLPPLSFIVRSRNIVNLQTHYINGRHSEVWRVGWTYLTHWHTAARAHAHKHIHYVYIHKCILYAYISGESCCRRHVMRKCNCMTDSCIQFPFSAAQRNTFEILYLNAYSSIVRGLAQRNTFEILYLNAYSSIVGGLAHSARIFPIFKRSFRPHHWHTSLTDTSLGTAALFWYADTWNN
jgi:hypothetical protein